MSQYTEIIKDLTARQFYTVLMQSPRAARQSYFRRHRIKLTKDKTMLLSLSDTKNNQQRLAAALWDILQTKADEPLCEEILRTYLLVQREMLSAALNHLGIAHIHGVTESREVEKIAALRGQQLQMLFTACVPHGEVWVIVLYLRFMGVPQQELMAVVQQQQVAAD